MSGLCKSKVKFPRGANRTLVTVVYLDFEMVLLLSFHQHQFLPSSNNKIRN
jgi:hypothetical protein